MTYASAMIFEGGVAIVSIVAAEGGTTVAIVISAFTFCTATGANVITYVKNRSDNKLARDQNIKSYEKSKVEIAQEVLMQTLQTTQAARAQDQKDFDKKIADLKAHHADAVRRLEARIDDITKRHETCREEKRRLIQRINESEGK